MPNAIPIQKADDLLTIFLTLLAIRGESFIASSLMGERKWISRRNHHGEVISNMGGTFRRGVRISYIGF
jgi:hypothetical protein